MSGDAGRTSIVLFGIHITARVIGFLGLMYFTRVLSQDELGVYFLFFLFVQVGSMVSNFGVGHALVRRVSEKTGANGVFSAALVVVSGAGALVTLLVYLFRNPVGTYIGLDVPALLSIAVICWLFADMHQRTLQGEDRVLTAGVIQLLQDVVRVGVGALLISIGYSTIGLIYGVIASFFLTAVIGYATSNLHLLRPERSDFTRLFSISRYTMFFGPTNLIYFWMDTFMIGLLLTTSDVSSYEVAWQTVGVLVIATAAINQTIFPKVSRWASQGAYEEIERVIPGAVLFSLIFPLPGLVGILVLGEDILSLVYQPAYSVAALPMAILAGYMAVESLQRLSMSILTGLERADVPFRARVVGVILAVVLNVLLIPPFGLVGAAVATFTAKFVDMILQWLTLRDVLAVRLPARSIGWQVVSALVMGGFVYLSREYVSLDSFATLAVVIGVAGGVYGLLVLFDSDVKAVIEQFLPFSVPFY